MPTPYPHTAHTSTNTFLHAYAHPATTHRHCTTTHVYILAATVLIPVSVSLPLALNLCSAPCRSLRHATACCLSCSPVPLPARLLSTYCSHVCLHYCAHSFRHHDITLGSAPVLTTLHHPYLLCVTPVACATTSPLRESTLTPCRFHHPYRSLTLAHRVVPPLVVPVPSLAVSGVRLSFMVPLAGESPLADARLPPHPNGHLLLAKRSPTHHAPLLASTPLYAYMSAFLYPCLLTCLPPVLSTSLLATFIQPCQHNAASIG